MSELLLELFSEEIPARMQARAADDLERIIATSLRDASLDYANIHTFVTPRRLVLVVEGLPEKQADVSEEKRGPKTNAPPAAIEGFLKANGVTREECEERKLEKGTFLFVVVENAGAATSLVLSRLLSDVIENLPWQKSMRWGAGPMRWVRSLERILCIFGGKKLSVETRNNVSCGDVTSGHRFLAPKPFSVESFADYENKLRDAYVVLDREKRKSLILDGAKKAADDEGLSLRNDPGLLEEVAGLVEWPVVMMGRIDETFMDVPEEVLITSMRAHQKYFSLLNKDGSLAPRFILVSNTETKDGGKSVVAGNERVLRARLSDANFFWDQDRVKTLESRSPALADSVFHARLGTMAQKVERVTALSGELARFIADCDAEKAMRAAHLSKTDLVSEMVCEFPTLQGTMGHYYALNDGEDAAVAKAIADHYSPAGPGDDCPQAPISIAVALADKLDTLVGFFAINEKPTGSRDPYALRRAALGIIRLVLENSLRLPLRETIMKACSGYSETVPDFQNTFVDGHRQKSVEFELLDFFADRLKVHLRGRGVRSDHIDAIFSLGREDDLLRVLARVDALSGFLATADGENLLAAYKRAANIVAIEEKKDNRPFDGDILVDKLVQVEEHNLVEALSGSALSASKAIDQEKYVAAMEALASLRVPVDLFFDKVTVNSDDADLRDNRLRLLAQLRSTLGEIADFGCIEG
ncbi:MAG: Glycine--tRNA ligase beta subunit [Alphaproteobacteria bacterium MarineAlpha11_Bin1]|nr:MAG: Glycine--tRNA ligase beta subunit [Alphaproteobacteria bacterium MarineAlpha11_Bin1]|tara:strand:+ start:4741 stop:6840 length:2100 start_codon:yes stop_codon:yes gene_type:complete